MRSFSVWVSLLGIFDRIVFLIGTPGFLSATAVRSILGELYINEMSLSLDFFSSPGRSIFVLLPTPAPLLGFAAVSGAVSLLA